MKAQTPQIDPAIQAQQQQEADQAKQANINALMNQSQQDTAALMARYGTRLALSNVGSSTGSPVAGR